MSRKLRKQKKGGTNGSEHLLRVGIAKAAFIRSGYRCTEGGQEDHVIWVFVEDVLESFLKLCHYGGRSMSGVLNESSMIVAMMGQSNIEKMMEKYQRDMTSVMNSLLLLLRPVFISGAR